MFFVIEGFQWVHLKSQLKISFHPIEHSSLEFSLFVYMRHSCCCGPSFHHILCIPIDVWYHHLDYSLHWISSLIHKCGTWFHPLSSDIDQNYFPGISGFFHLHWYFPWPIAQIMDLLTNLASLIWYINRDFSLEDISVIAQSSFSLEWIIMFWITAIKSKYWLFLLFFLLLMWSHFPWVENSLQVL